MKKIVGILFTFLIIGFLVSLIVGFTHSVPTDVSLNYVKSYKFCNAVSYFLKFLPGIIFAGFVVGCSVQFGHNPEGSLKRFSGAMGKRYKVVMIVAIIITAILTIANETVGLFVNRKKIDIINRPKIIKEYLEVGNSLYEQGYYARAARYADAVLKLDDKSEGANDLKNRTNLEGNINKPKKVPRFNAKNAEPVTEVATGLIIDEQKMSQAHEYLLKAKDAFAKEKWFDAHYFAEIGIKLTTSKDPNVDELKTISNKAWNNIQEIHNTKKTEDQINFEEKYRGYVALMEEDDLRAYYIFRHLSESSEKLSKDPDVVFYLGIAKTKVEEKFFFVDETLELSNFETANDVYYTCKYKNGNIDVIYFKGMTEVQASGLNVQYLRDLCITTIDAKGNFVKSLKVPYVKVLPAHISNFDESVKRSLEIEDDVEYVPYLILKSVGRDDSSIIYEPEYKFANGIVQSKSDYMLLPMDFDDLVMLETSPENPQTIPLFTLFKLVSKAYKYGYSEEMYGQTLLNRLLYPLFLLCFIVLLASFAWNNRIGQDQYFKFSWVLSFPFVALIMEVFYQMLYFVFKLLNYVLLAFTSNMVCVILGCVLYVLVLFAVSVYYLSRNTAE